MLHMRYMVKSYEQQIRELHEGLDVPLLHCFTKAGVPSSTYYRMLQGTELKLGTAQKVYRIIELLKGSYSTSSDKRNLHGNSVSKLSGRD